MKRRLIAVLAILALGAVALGADAVKLPAPDKTGGKPLMQALAERHSTREFADKAIPDQVLSNLLWAAWGVNRADSGKRTAPSAMNWQETDIYVVKADGTFLYDAREHALKPVLSDDIRALAGRQDFVAKAPVNLVYVADRSKMGKASDEDKAFYGGADTGFIAQNVYLFCASEGLGTVVRGWVDRDALGKKLKLKSSQHITLSQTVGYPK